MNWVKIAIEAIGIFIKTRKKPKVDDLRGEMSEKHRKIKETVDRIMESKKRKPPA
jgi:hypothetical protein